MLRTISEDQQQLDERESAVTLSDVPHQMDMAISNALRTLAETGIETGTHELRHKHCQKEREEGVRKFFEHEIGQWKPNLADPKNIVPFFDYLRKRCYELDDNTNAWCTIWVFSEAARASIKSHLQNDSLDEGERLLLYVIDNFFLFQQQDVSVYQGINRGSNHGVINCLQLGLGTLKEIFAMLNSADVNVPGSALRGWQAELGKELQAEAQAYREVALGIHSAARALVQFEDEVRRFYNKDLGENWPSGLEIKALTDADAEVSEAIAHLDEDLARWRDELRSAPMAWLSDIASRLNPWKSLLHALGATYRNRKPMWLPTVRIRYFYPFTVEVTEDKVRDLSPALGRRVPGRTEVAADESERKHKSKETQKSLAAELGARLRRLGQGVPEVESLKLSDFWTAAGEGMFGGNRVHLPALSDTDNPEDDWEVHVDLSRLGNHCLCIERTLENPTPHELYKALRCPADYSWDWIYRYESLPSQAARPANQEAMTDHYRWRSVDDFAHDVILIMAQGLTGENEPEYIKGHFHEMALVPESVPIEKLNDFYGSELFRTNLHRDAATLEEWLRYPAAENDGSSILNQAKFGYRENWLSVLDDATIFGLAGNPSWQADSYLEAVQFAVSWSPRLLLWNRKIMQALEEGGDKKESSELRKLERDVRRSISVAHAEELCRLPSDRRYLDSILDSIGITRMEQELERQIHAVQLLIAANEKNDQDNKDGRRNFFLGALALFSVLNLSTVFAVLNAGDNKGFFTNRSAIRWEFVAQIALLVLFGLVWFSLSMRFWRKRT